ncbi:flp pilus-assembly TadE/G-like family protein [Corynebacterium felinum]|uniref:Secretion/DNA translocation related TadE-like protein n=1 Tax=Corynebacterium felinum TaxID=131318 RepID=A0ABU2B649_9CORY|nr:Rv3654c family TadE-like protein [Corynebacterium felinum]MDF5820653.1 flp pilus-assembly TadE/G-like family protein [Corynebacterium felinum]MDR7354092.1 secretion/DNA translocation related TadE-like protein [Corynebacterium felinum]WJY96264.1 hypothetical protein CFELI_13425 [Corynebacterium felinum]
MQLWHEEHGSTTVLTAGIIAILALISVVFFSHSHTTIDAHKTRNAADLAAVAAAYAHHTTGEGCHLAAEIASDNGATLTHCHIDGGDAYVTVEGLKTTARARAGPMGVD